MSSASLIRFKNIRKYHFSLMRLSLFLSVLLLTACHSSEKSEPDALNTRTVTLPDGFKVATEVEVNPADMERGMMYRTDLLPGHGMLFVHGTPGRYPYWMANCKIPLDIVWLDQDHRVVEISPDTPACPSGGNDCPTYGGHAMASFGLELGGGEAAKHKVVVGSTISF
jgi:uncharacterized membrane protein (UPF0127 family)